MQTQAAPSYYVLEAQNPKRMLLTSLQSPALGQSWLHGQRFKTQPKLPVKVGIIKGYEKSEPLDYFGTPPIISERFWKALVEAGVDNLDVYDAVISSEDKKVVLEGYKAFNVIGLVAAADETTKFSSDNPSRLLDASIEQLVIDPSRAMGLLLFRLKEYSGAIIVHEHLKQRLEKHNFPHVFFREPGELIS
jgi:hypothetical protein